MTTSTVTHPASTSARLRATICTLSAVTALVHLYLAVAIVWMIARDPEQVAELGGSAALGVMAGLFLLSFAGYVVLTLALYHPALARLRRRARPALIVWAAGNILAYVAMIGGNVDAFGLVDKAVEVALIVALVVEGRRARA
jgi:hypothetical protein